MSRTMTFFRAQALETARFASGWTADRGRWNGRLMVGNLFLSGPHDRYETTECR